MGTDIHLVLERKRKDNSLSSIWESCGILGDGEWSDRNYAMFYRLYADADYLSDSVRYIVPKRGFPQDVESDIAFKYGFLVVPEAQFDFEVSEKVAESYVQNQSCDSHYFEVPWDNGQRRFVSNPEFHHANWITAEELEKAMMDVNPDWSAWKEQPSEWFVLLQAMKMYDSNPDFVTRAVYWFDN